jgi:AcrR family transcriptional regulator
MKADTVPRAHASYGTGRARLLIAARETFAENGYRGATTRDIAERAGLTEPMVFRHFGSKAALFEEAAVEPVIAFMDDYVAEWGTREHGSTDAVQEVHDFVSRLHEVMQADRQLLIAILAAGQFDETLELAADRLNGAFRRIIEMFEAMVDTEFTLRGLDTPDRPAFARVLLGIVIAFSLHAGWLASGDGMHEVGVDRLLNEAARLAVFGVDSRPTAP